MSTFNDLFKDASNEHLNNLDLIIQMGSSISNESKTMAFIDSAKSKFYDYVERVQSFIKSLSFTSLSSPQIVAEKLLSRYGEQSYAENRKLLFYVAPGFSGNLISFLDLLGDRVLPAAEAAENSLKITLTRLATLLNEPDRLKAQSGIRDLEAHLNLVPGDVLEKVRTYFKPGSKSQVYVGDVMDRNADLAEVIQKTNQINGRMSKVDFKRLSGLVDRLGQLTGALNKQLNEGENGREEVAGTVASQLSDLFYRIGITLTSCSVLIEMMRQHTEATRRGVEELIGQMPASVRENVLNLGCQSNRVLLLAERFSADMKKPLAKLAATKATLMKLRGDALNQAEKIFDRVCESWYLGEVVNDRSAVTQFTNDVDAVAAEIKELAA